MVDDESFDGYGDSSEDVFLDRRQLKEDLTHPANGPRIGSKVRILRGGYRGQIGKVVDIDFDEEEVLEAYINSLHDCYAKLDAELLSDDEYSKTWEQSKFISAVNTGQIEFKQPEVSNKKMRKLKRFLKRIGKKVSV